MIHVNNVNIVFALIWLDPEVDGMADVVTTFEGALSVETPTIMAEVGVAERAEEVTAIDAFTETIGDEAAIEDEAEIDAFTGTIEDEAAADEIADDDEEAATAALGIAVIETVPELIAP